MSAEQLSDAEIEARGIERMIDDIEARTVGAEMVGGVGSQADAVPQMSDAELLTDFLGLIPVSAELAGMKKTAEIWHEKTRSEVAERVVKVLGKYAWGRDILEKLRFGGYVDEIALAITLWPIVRATIETARGEIMEIRNRAKEESGEQGGSASA
jgi:hypothetical protein